MQLGGADWPPQAPLSKVQSGHQAFLELRAAAADGRTAPVLQKLLLSGGTSREDSVLIHGESLHQGSDTSTHTHDHVLTAQGGLQRRRAHQQSRCPGGAGSAAAAGHEGTDLSSHARIFRVFSDSCRTIRMSCGTGDPVSGHGQKSPDSPLPLLCPHMPSGS